MSPSARGGGALTGWAGRARRGGREGRAGRVEGQARRLACPGMKTEEKGGWMPANCAVLSSG